MALDKLEVQGEWTIWFKVNTMHNILIIMHTTQNIV